MFVCLPMAELVYLTLFTVLSRAPNTQSARQTPKYCFLVGHLQLDRPAARDAKKPVFFLEVFLKPVFLRRFFVGGMANR
jgi:hypothetical protein